MDATQRALAIYGTAYSISGGNVEGAQSDEMTLCEDVYPAILYNAAVFHEVSKTCVYVSFAPYRVAYLILL